MCGEVLNGIAERPPYGAARQPDFHHGVCGIRSLGETGRLVALLVATFAAATAGITARTATDAVLAGTRFIHGQRAIQKHPKPQSARAFDERGELLEEIARVVRTGRGLGMILHAEDG